MGPVLVSGRSFPYHQTLKLLIACIAVTCITFFQMPGSVPGMQVPASRHGELVFSNHSSLSHASQEPAIKNMMAQDIVSAVSAGKSNSYVTRGDFAVLMQHMFNLPKPSRLTVFPDVSQKDAIYAAVEAVAPYMNMQLLCISCYLNHDFFPNSPISRAESTITFVRLLIAVKRIQLLSASSSKSVLSKVSDAQHWPLLARIYFATAIKSRIVTLRAGNTFQGAQPLTHADAAIMLADFKRHPIKRFQHDFVSNNADSSTNIDYQGGPVMQTVKAYLIFWLPQGFSYAPNDSSVPDGIGNYEALIASYFNKISASDYLNILTQYPGTCGSNACILRNSFGVVSHNTGDTFLDTRAYPHAGTTSDPLQESDIQQEIKNIIQQNGLSTGLNAEFFVFTGANVQECSSFGQCTFQNVQHPLQGLCAYHENFSFMGNAVIYAFMPNDAPIRGCMNILTPPNGQVSSDDEIEVMSHEFAESITDPLINAWTNSTAGEIGDPCSNDLGIVQPDGSNVSFNGSFYIVQPIWSNDSSNCVLDFGPSIQFMISTGDDDLRGDSSASVVFQSSNGSILQTETLKSQDQSSWDNNTTHVVVFGLDQLQAQSLWASGKIAITLTSHPGLSETPDNWNIQNLNVQFLSPYGQQLCVFNMGGNPLVRLTGSASTATFTMPNCLTTAPPQQATVTPSPQQTFNRVEFNITTGGDNLRGDSSAIAVLHLSNTSSQTCTLKSQNDPEWENYTDHVTSCDLDTPQPLSAFGNIVITLTSHNGFLETDDNWNIQSVHATVSNFGNNPMCLVNVGGNPLVRLTGSASSYTLRPRSGCT